MNTRNTGDTMSELKSILITGASSGIGEALALYYAAPGVHLFLTGRDQARTDAVAAACAERGAVAEGTVISVTDRDAMDAYVKACDAKAPLDLVIANAGVGTGPTRGGPLADTTDYIFAANVHGVFHTVHPAIELMKARKSGQIAINASVAGFIGLPSSTPYAASKAAARSYGEGLRGAYARQGIRVSVICPGFVVSRMTDVNNFKMPFLMTAERAAKIIARGLRRNKGRIAFPWPTFWAIRLLQILPYPLVDRLTRKAPIKEKI